MMMKNVLFAVALLSVALCAGCATGGDGHTRGIQVEVKSDHNADVVGVTLTLQFTATVTGTDNHAVTWSLKQNGVACNACGTINASGLYTAPATAPTPADVDVVATSQADTSRSGSFSLTVVQITVIVTPKLNNNDPLNIVKGVTQQFTGSALPDAAPQTFNWTLTCDGGGTTCGTINANSGLFTAPNAVPATPTGHITATSTIDPTGVDTVNIVIVKSRLSANSTYAFRVSGFDAAGDPIAVVGNFATDVNGGITGGTEDELNTVAHNIRIITSGNLSIDTNVHGTLTLNTSAGPHTYKVAFNAVGDGKMIEFDSNGHSSGEIAQATPSKFKDSVLTAASSFVFGLSGVDTVLKRAGVVGLFKPDGLGGIASGMLDLNLNGIPASSTNVTGSYDIQSDGRGTLTLTDNTASRTYNYAIYVIGGVTNKAANPLTLFVISSDDPQSRPAVSGTIVFQDPTPAPYDAADFNDFAVSSLTGVNSSGHALVALVNSRGDGTGHVDAFFDANNAGTIVSQQDFNCTYTSSGNGRYIVTLLGNGTSCGAPALPFVFYASANSRGFLLDQSSTAVYTGQMDLQPGPDFAPSAMAGSFAAATSNPGTSGASHAAMNFLFTSASPDFTVGGKQDETNGGQNAGQTLDGTYDVSLDGTGTVDLTQPAAAKYVMYLLDTPNSKDGMAQHFVMINVDPANSDPSIIFGER